MRCRLAWAAVLVSGAAGLAGGAAGAQGSLPLTQQMGGVNQVSPLDLSRTVQRPALERDRHIPLPEQYIWTATDATADGHIVYRFPGWNEQTEPHFFRAHFAVSQIPSVATLYLAGPRSVQVWVNGQMAERVESDLTQPLGMHVFAVDVARWLHAGDNVIAVRAVRGRGVTGFANSALVQQQTSGRVLVAKLMAAPLNVEGPVLLRSDGAWKSTTAETQGWEQVAFADSGWRAVQSFGGIESSIEMFQWNADAGLYDWPGYDGISGFLARMKVPASGILTSYAGRGAFSGLEALTGGAGEFSVTLPQPKLTEAEAPAVELDFGRELTGRVQLVSDSDQPVTVTVQVGESESEMRRDPYLGVNQMVIPPHGTGYGPKSAFRYARIRFVGGAGEARFRSIVVDHTFLPVEYLGSFESSDPLLNSVWQVGAYTAHLCMQDGVWDASKRDRGRWMGDLDVSGRVIDDVFAERPLMEDTLDRLLGPAPVTDQVNGIPGYSAFWFTGVADLYRHTGDLAFLRREHDRMVQLLGVVDREFDARNLYANKSNVWLYVDWSAELNGDTPETRRATTLEFLRAYREAAYLLRELGDTVNAEKYEARAAAVESASRQYLQDSSGTFGPRWQTNAAAVLSGAASPAQYPAIWRDVLSGVGTRPEGSSMAGPWIISPYYGDYVLRAMAEMGHRTEAVAWIREYWGGMLREGATSFWEAYDPDWYKEDFHSSLQADNRSGYFVSLAHGWAAGPAAWLMEEVLGVQPTGAGFKTVDVRPDLADLQYARGAVPTPHGLVQVDATRQGLGVRAIMTIPEGVVARVLVPGSAVTVNGAAMQSVPAEGGARQAVVLSRAGRYEVVGR